MNVLTAIVLGLAMGAVFGIALEKSRVFEPGAIVSQMQLRTFLMLKIFLTAVVTGLIVLAALNGVWGVKMYPKALVWPADIVGGLILGVGISIAGACPGTVFAQLGAGYRDAWFTGAGGILGAMAFGYLEPVVRTVLLSGGPGKPTFDQLAHVPFWAFALAGAAVLVAVLIALERSQPWRSEVGPNVDGLSADGRATRAAGKLSSASA
jgi:uncharacterized membrane protein YedE/YeeE